MKVSEFNRRAAIKYSEAWREWNPEKGGTPYYPMYAFTNIDGSDKKSGFVLSIENRRHFWKKTKRECIELLKREEE